MINYTPPTQHTTLFYKSEEEYLDIIIPYLKAGLENNEFCVWVVPETLKVEDAQAYLRQSVEDLNDYFAKEQLVIGDYKNFYLKNEIFSAYQTIENFIDVVKKALKKGFKGVRATGDGSWALNTDYWFMLLMYEKDVSEAFEPYNIRAICSYSLAKLNLKDILEIGMEHQSSLVNLAGKWDRVTPDRLVKIGFR